MSINATLLGQMVTFGLLVWFTMRFVWPLLRTALDERERKISEGLAAAELGHKELAEAHEKAKHAIKLAHEKGAEIVAEAKRQAELIVNFSKEEAARERGRILVNAELEVSQAYQKARQTLKGELSDLVVLTTEKLLNRALTAEDQQYLSLKLVQ